MKPDHESMRSAVMDAIRKGKVRMKPRWQFALQSLMYVVGVIALLLALLYTVSLGVFLMRASGVWFVPAFGFRGWFALLHALPWLLIVLLIVFVALLQILVYRFSFVYGKPLVVSFVAIIAVIFFGGYIVARTPLHRHIEAFARHGMLPPPVGMWYHGPVEGAEPPDLYHGYVIGTTSDGFIMFDEDDATTSIIITPRTRLPYGEDFSPDTMVVVVGDTVASGTVQAFGISAFEPEEDRN